MGRMQWKREFTAARWILLTVYQKFKHLVITVLTGLVTIVLTLAVWTLTVKTLGSVLSTGFAPSEYAVFQLLFGTTFTVIIALEFRRSLLILPERRRSVVQVRAVVIIAVLVIVRKLLIVDPSTTSTQQMFALAAAILALGGVHWLVRDQDRREDA
jgi:uncharacterized membrane protein (DUF373 family)